MMRIRNETGKTYIFIDLSLIGRTDNGNNVGIDQCTELLIVDSEIVEEGLQERNQLNQTLVAEENERFDDNRTSITVHNISHLVHQVEQNSGVILQNLQLHYLPTERTSG